MKVFSYSFRYAIATDYNIRSCTSPIAYNNWIHSKDRNINHKIMIIIVKNLSCFQLQHFIAKQWTYMYLSVFYSILTHLRVSLMHALKYFKLSMFVTSRGMSLCGRTWQISLYAKACFSGCSAS